MFGVLGQGSDWLVMTSILYEAFLVFLVYKVRTHQIILFFPLTCIHVNLKLLFLTKFMLQVIPYPFCSVFCLYFLRSMLSTRMLGLKSESRLVWHSLLIWLYGECSRFWYAHIQDLKPSNSRIFKTATLIQLHKALSCIV